MHEQGPDGAGAGRQQPAGDAGDPLNSGICQAIGAEMRSAGIEAVEYHSARSAQDVVQVAAISCRVFTGTPFDQVEVQVEESRNQVSFRCLDDNSMHHFDRQQFEVNGELPRPMH
jgi:hypothetical protein